MLQKNLYRTTFVSGSHNDIDIEENIKIAKLRRPQLKSFQGTHQDPRVVLLFNIWKRDYPKFPSIWKNSTSLTTQMKLSWKQVQKSERSSRCLLRGWFVGFLIAAHRGKRKARKVERNANTIKTFLHFLAFLDPLLIFYQPFSNKSGNEGLIG